MELKLKKQPQKYLASVDAPIKGYANRYRYKILHYRITFEWVKGEIVITVIEINTRTNIKY